MQCCCFVFIGLLCNSACRTLRLLLQLCDITKLSIVIMNMVEVQQNPAIAESLFTRIFYAIAGFSAILQVTLPSPKNHNFKILFQYTRLCIFFTEFNIKDQDNIDHLKKNFVISVWFDEEISIFSLNPSLIFLEGKRYQNNFQERNFLRDLKIPPFFPCYVAEEDRRELQIT